MASGTEIGAEAPGGHADGADFLTVVSFKKAHLSIRENEPLVTNVDGDLGPTFPLDLEILPSRLPVFVPAHPKEDQGILPRFLKAPHLHLPWEEGTKI